MFLRALEPFAKSVIHFYKKFNMYKFRNLGYSLWIMRSSINLSRLTIHIAFDVCFIVGFSNIFFFITNERIVEFIQFI
jgi:hypothetical protein